MNFVANAFKKLIQSDATEENKENGHSSSQPHLQQTIQIKTVQSDIADTESVDEFLTAPSSHNSLGSMETIDTVETAETVESVNDDDDTLPEEMCESFEKSKTVTFVEDLIEKPITENIGVETDSSSLLLLTVKEASSYSQESAITVCSARGSLASIDTKDEEKSETIIEKPKAEAKPVDISLPGPSKEKPLVYCSVSGKLINVLNDGIEKKKTGQISYSSDNVEMCSEQEISREESHLNDAPSSIIGVLAAGHSEGEPGLAKVGPDFGDSFSSTASSVTSLLGYDRTRSSFDPDSARNLVGSSAAILAEESSEENLELNTESDTQRNNYSTGSNANETVEIKSESELNGTFVCDKVQKEKSELNVDCANINTTGANQNNELEIEVPTNIEVDSGIVDEVNISGDTDDDTLTAERVKLAKDQLNSTVVLESKNVVEENIEVNIEKSEDNLSKENPHNVTNIIEPTEVIKEFENTIEDIKKTIDSVTENNIVNEKKQNTHNTSKLKKEPAIEIFESPKKLPNNKEVEKQSTVVVNNSETVKNNGESIVIESKETTSDSESIPVKMADIETHTEISNLKLQLNAAQQTIASLELEIHQKEEVIIKTQAESMKIEQALKEENKQLKEKVKESSKINEKSETKDLEEAIKEAQAREHKALNALNARTEAEAHYENIMQRYEKKLKEKIVDLQKHKEDHETVSRHLANIELAFSDLHQKYERTKAVLEGFKTNEDTLRQNLQIIDEKYKLNEEKYIALKGHAKAQIDKSNKSVQEMKEKYELEICKLRSVAKRLEIKCTALETALEQKTKECDELSALCDDLFQTEKKV